MGADVPDKYATDILLLKHSPKSGARGGLCSGSGCLISRPKEATSEMYVENRPA